MSLRIRFGKSAPDDSLAVARLWYDRIKKMGDCPYQWLQNHGLLEADQALEFCAMYTKRTNSRMYLHDLVCCGCEAEALSEQSHRIREFFKICSSVPESVGTGRSVLAQYKIEVPEAVAHVDGSL